MEVAEVVQHWTVSYRRSCEEGAEAKVEERSNEWERMYAAVVVAVVAVGGDDWMWVDDGVCEGKEGLWMQT